MPLIQIVTPLHFLTLNKRNLTGYLLTAVSAWVLLHLYGCANVLPPGGGPKDVTNPVLVRSNPKNGTVNFKGKLITLEFDEDVAENALQTQLIITPYMEGNIPRTLINRNKETIEFDKELPANSTISLNFRDGIKDVKEGNICRNLHIVFSTGPQIDSLAIHGTVKELLTKNPSTQTVVGLYPVTDTLNIYKHKPYYFTKTDSIGRFHLQNLKAGRYELIAYTDKNSNLVYNDKQELLAFLPTYLTITPDSLPKGPLNLELINTDTEKPRRLDDAVRGWSYKLSYNENIQAAKFTLKEPYTLYRRVNKKSVTLFSLKPIPDTLHALVTVTDSMGNNATDTVAFKLADKRDTGSKTKVALKKYVATPAVIPGRPIVFEFSDSIKKFRQDGITLRLDSQKAEAPLQFTWNPEKTKLEVYTRPFSKGLIVYTEKGTFTSLLDSVNRTADTLQLKPADDGNFGVINCSVNPVPGPYLLQLLNDKYEVVEQVANKPTYTFRFVAPGGYYLRVVEDANNNGLYDLGSYKTRTMPEKCRVFKDKIAIKANWEIEEIKL